jgi:hypothetical protein
MGVYSDPTANIAIMRVMRAEEKKNRKRKNQRLVIKRKRKGKCNGKID